MERAPLDFKLVFLQVSAAALLCVFFHLLLVHQELRHRWGLREGARGILLLRVNVVSKRTGA